MKVTALSGLLIISALILPSIAGYGLRSLLFEDFDSAVPPGLPSGWIAINANGDLGVWETRGYGGVTWHHPCVRYVNDLYTSADDWLFTSGVSLTTGVQYTLEFMYRRSSGGHVEALSIFAGQAQDPTSVPVAIWSAPAVTNTDYLKAAAAFTVPVSGTYYIGFHAESPAGVGRLYVDEIDILMPEDRLEVDLGLTQELYQTGTLTYGVGDTIECMTYVVNVGDSALTINNAFAIGAGDKSTNLQFEITAPGDSILRIINIYEMMLPLEPKHFSLIQPDSLMVKFIDLDEWYDMDTPGQYTIEARYMNYADPFGMDAWMGYLVSDPVIIIIE
jgi:hypothetical protein